MKYSRSLLCLSFFLSEFLLATPLVKAEVLRVTSTPSGAKVEIDNVAVGTTPYEVKVPGGYFHKTRTLIGARLEHAMTLRVSMDGYLGGIEAGRSEVTEAGG
jgi:hypothetical protein